MEISEDKWQEVTEGSTTFSIYKDADRIYDASVFYNPKMVVNRDLTILSLSSIVKREMKKICFLDPFAGTGVRSYRIINELPQNSVEKVVAGDINPIAVNIITRNSNNLNFDEKMEIKHSNAINILDSLPKKKDTTHIIDLDPFGSPIEYIEESLRALRINEGYLFATATDLQVLCGKFPDSCYRIYNAIPTRHFLCHEVALRILIYNMIISAGRLGIAVEPNFCYNHEHFLRVKVKVKDSKEIANKQHKKLGFVYFCKKCSYMKTVELSNDLEDTSCTNCSEKLEKAGPLWLGNLYDIEFIEQMKKDIGEFTIQHEKKIEKVLSLILDEIKSPPFF
ncbi:MAG: RsmD family RNA methyltransferase, partial [Candidatus Heimdallarchaeota archaeon]|nr:RsmD family RNA methyltransferase [Candidatus Heimdallarchaeota archaeon]